MNRLWTCLKPAVDSKVSAVSLRNKTASASKGHELTTRIVRGISRVMLEDESQTTWFQDTTHLAGEDIP